MTSRVAPRCLAQPLGDAAIAALAWASASAGIVLGGKPLWVALVTLAIPMLAFIALGHLAGRGAVVACVASALGLGMASTSGGSGPWMAVGLIGLIDAAAFAGGLMAERMAPAQATDAPAATGRWMTVVVQHEAIAEATPRLTPAVAPVVVNAAPMDRTRRHARPGRSRRVERTA
jgi:hypothetical protein